MISALVIEISGAFDMKMKTALNRCLGSQIGHFFKRLEIFRPAVRVPAVVYGIGANKDDLGLKHLCQARAKARKIVLRAGT